MSLTEADLPVETLAMVFLFARIHPRAGALDSARLVCKRWREVIDAHLHLERPAWHQLFASAMQLGYLTPLVGAQLDKDDAFEKIEFIVEHSVRTRNEHLFAWTRDFVVRWPGAALFTRAEVKSLTETIDAIENRILIGLWNNRESNQPLSAETLRSFIHLLHPLDLRRAEALDVVPTTMDLPTIFANGTGEESNYAAWKEWEIRCAANDGEEVVVRNAASVPWLLRRGLLDANNLRDWIRGLLQAGGPGDADMVAGLLRVASNEGWNVTIYDSDLRLVFRHDDGWPLVEGILPLLEARERDRLWRPLAHGVDFFGFVLRCFPDPPPHRAVNARARPTVAAGFEWLLYMGLFRDATPRDMHTLLARVLDTQPLAFNVPVLAWVLTHLPKTTNNAFLTDVFRVDAMHMLPAFLPAECHVPWDPIGLYQVMRDDRRETQLRTLFEAGYRLPPHIEFDVNERANNEYWQGWSRLLILAADYGQSTDAFTFDDAFLEAAIDHPEAGWPLLQQLLAAGVALPEHVWIRMT